MVAAEAAAEAARTEAAPEADGGTDGGRATSSDNTFRKALDIKDFAFSQRSGELLVKLPGAVFGQQFIIEDCTDCDILVLDWSAMVTVDRCQRCRIFLGPCESSVFLRNCDDIRAVIACQQFRTRDVVRKRLPRPMPRTRPAHERVFWRPCGLPMADPPRLGSASSTCCC